MQLPRERPRSCGSALHVMLFLEAPQANVVCLQWIAKRPWLASITWISLPNYHRYFH
jgi:hypothetical protein